MRPAAPELARQIQTAEEAVWTALAEGDADADRRLLSAGFLGLYPSGPAGREDHAGALDTGPTAAEWALRDVRVFSLAPGLALIAYRAGFLRLSDRTRQDWWISSIWRETQAGGWENIFSQDTPAAQ